MSRLCWLAWVLNKDPTVWLTGASLLTPVYCRPLGGPCLHTAQHTKLQKWHILFRNYLVCGFRLHKCLNAHVPNCASAQSHKCPVAQVPGCASAQSHKCPVAQVPSRTSTQLHKCPVAQAPSCTSTQLHKHPVAQAPSCTSTQLHKHPVAQAPIYEESVVVRIKSNLLPMIFWLHIINYNS